MDKETTSDVLLVPIHNRLLLHVTTNFVFTVKDDYNWDFDLEEVKKGNG